MQLGRYTIRAAAHLLISTGIRRCERASLAVIPCEIRATSEQHGKSARISADASVTNERNAIKLIASLIRRHTNLCRESLLLLLFHHHHHHHFFLLLSSRLIASHKYLITASHVRDYSISFAFARHDCAFNIEQKSYRTRSIFPRVCSDNKR